MMRRRYDEELAGIKDKLRAMCATDALAVRMAMSALRKKDAAEARGVKAHERAADAFETEIERRCMLIVVKQQPVAHDLTFVTSAMKMVTDLERISDQAADTAEITVRLVEKSYVLPAALAELMRTAEDMTERCSAALATFDSAQAKIICKTDDVADGLFGQVRRELSRDVETAAGETALDLLMIAKYLERICDHAVNVAEWILFALGERPWL